MTDTLATIVAEMRTYEGDPFGCAHHVFRDWADRIEALQAGEAVAWLVEKTWLDQIPPIGFKTCPPDQEGAFPVFTHPAACMAPAHDEAVIRGKK